MTTLAPRLEAMFDRLWPICRSLAGPGFRDSLDILSEVMPVDRLAFPSGSAAFDWTVPKEWHPRDAYIVGPDGRKRCDFKANNLHLVGYSAPFRGRMPLERLRPHLHSLPDQPTAIPYLTSYYKEAWGFCLSHEELKALPDGEYEVVVDTELRDGMLEVGEAVLPGDCPDEILFSTYLCHPSLANNELSGPLVTAFLYERLAALPRRRWTYRFVVAPETIGTLCFLTRRGEHLLRRLKAGYVVTCAGDDGPFHYKESRRGGTLADRAAKAVLRGLGEHRLLPFVPTGSDERQYCSPGFDLPVGSLMRTPYGRYAEYHTSLDDKSFVSFDAMAGSVEAYAAVAEALEANRVWTNTVRFGEPQLGKRGLYPNLGSRKDTAERIETTMWLLNLADGTRDLLEIAERSGRPISDLAEAARPLAEAGLLKEPEGVPA